MFKDEMKQYTGSNINGVVTLETDIRVGISLADGDYWLNEAELKVGIIEIAVGHDEHMLIVPADYAVNSKLYIVSNMDDVKSAMITGESGDPIIIGPYNTAIVRVGNVTSELLRVTENAQTKKEFI